MEWKGPRGLVLAGGGARGAYQVGALRALIEAGRRYDFVAGISVGALNGSLLAQYKPKHQDTGIRDLEAIWRGITGNESIYTPWFLGKLAALWKGGLFDTTPLRTLIGLHFKPEQLAESGVRLRMGAVALGSGEYRTFTEQEGAHLPDAIMASSAFPIAFPPVLLDGDYWLDGGVRDITPVRDALHDYDGPLDVVLTSPVLGDQVVQAMPTAPGLAAVGLRTIALMADEVFLTDLDRLKEAKHSVSVFAPGHALPDPLQFLPNYLVSSIEYGYLRTKEQLSQP